MQAPTHVEATTALEPRRHVVLLVAYSSMASTISVNDTPHQVIGNGPGHCRRVFND